MFCKVSMIGYVKTDKSFNQGGNVMTVCVSYGGTRKSLTTGKYESTLIPCTFFNETAQRADKVIRKGILIYIEGRLNISEYEKNGEKRKYTSVNVNHFNVLSGIEAEVYKSPNPRNINSIEKYNIDGDDEKPMPF